MNGPPLPRLVLGRQGLGGPVRSLAAGGYGHVARDEERQSTEHLFLRDGRFGGTSSRMSAAEVGTAPLRVPIPPFWSPMRRQSSGQAVS